jgi:tetratricopeptide (TPR) repeat protein
LAIPLVGIVLFQFTSREDHPAMEPSEVPVPQGDSLPLDTTVERKVIEEKPIDRQVALEGVPGGVLSEPQPSEREVSAETESARTLDAMALDAWKKGDLVRSLGLFEEAVKADPDDAIIRTNYGRMLTKMGAFNKASTHLLRAAELQPDDPTAWLNLQSLYERQFLTDQAQHAAERAEAVAGGQRIVQDEFGDWMLEGDSTH